MRIITSFSSIEKLSSRVYVNDMSYLYVPYKNDAPLPVDIKGHKLLIVSGDATDLENNLRKLGADSFKKVSVGNTPEEHTQKLAMLAKKAKLTKKSKKGGESPGILVAPTELGLSELLKNLETSLPWVM